MNILFYAKSPDATETYRVTIPAKYLSRIEGVNVRTSYAEKYDKIPGSGARFSDMDWADVIVFQRPATEVSLKLIQRIRADYPSKVLLLDYDDCYYSVPRWNPGFPYIKMNEKYWHEMPKLVDGIITSTEPLREIYQSKTSAEVVTIKNGFDFEMFDEAQFSESTTIHNPRIDGDKVASNYSVTLEDFREIQKERTTVTWAGSRFHYMDLEVIAKDLRKLSHERPDINFLFVSYIQTNLLKGIAPNSVFTSPGIAPIERFYGYLKSLPTDIMIAPLDPCQFNSSKSSLKTKEAMAIGNYPIVSDWCAYEDDLHPDLVDDEVHGHIVGYEEGDWYRAICEASEKVKDQSYVKEFRAANDLYVRSTHEASLRSQEYVNFFTKLLGKK